MDIDERVCSDELEVVKKKKSKKRRKKKTGKAAGNLPCNVHEIQARELFERSEDMLSKWWTAYTEAFKVEHEWVESKGQRTSRGMGLGVQQMMPLVFEDEIGSSLHRVCFVATTQSGPFDADDEAVDDICGYATVDENPDSTGVCHLRMLLVPVEYQKKGVGLNILNHVVNSERFKGRHLGLKFAKCHEYEKLYGKVGFAVIGSDEMYVYMALRR
jgi:hypothetical protein